MDKVQEEWVRCIECIFQNNCEIKVKIEKELGLLPNSPMCGCKKGISYAWLAQMQASRQENENI